MPARTKRAGHKDRKIISVSSKRQITIPKKFFQQLKFGKEVECFLEDDGIVIRPIQLEENEFSIEILRELVAQGYSGEELIKKFEAERKKIKSAVDSLLQEGEEISSGKKKGSEFEDLFGPEE